jgi:protein-L-isoaspartate(D-aspartate) O-methyltransferase
VSKLVFALCLVVPILGCRREPERGKSQPPAAFLMLGERQSERDHMVRETIAKRGVKDPRVLAAMRRVPRHLFVPESQGGAAYADRPLPIGWGQTISQPYIVAAMTEAVAPAPGERCLEIGTGSGYQAAVLAELCDRVYSIEYVPELAKFADENLEIAGYRVELRTGDGYAGWPEAQPFDVIVVTAAPERVPQPLLDQLALGGRLVIPVGPEGGVQELSLYVRRRPGRDPSSFERRSLAEVRFVPFLGDAGAP